VGNLLNKEQILSGVVDFIIVPSIQKVPGSNTGPEVGCPL
jgi:hypothetical protein